MREEKLMDEPSQWASSSGDIECLYKISIHPKVFHSRPSRWTTWATRPSSKNYLCRRSCLFCLQQHNTQLRFNVNAQDFTHMLHNRRLNVCVWSLQRGPATHSPVTRVRYEERELQETSMCWHTETHTHTHFPSLGIAVSLHHLLSTALRGRPLTMWR